jgi:hypothetical protein
MRAIEVQSLYIIILEVNCKIILKKYGKVQISEDHGKKHNEIKFGECLPFVLEYFDFASPV